MILSIGDTVVLQQVSWRRPGATDFRMVQGAHNLAALANLVAAVLTTLPIAASTSNSARTVLTGIASLRKGVYGGLILIAVALLPKIVALILIYTPSRSCRRISFSCWPCCSSRA